MYPYVFGGLPLTVCLLMNPPVMQNSLSPQSSLLQGHHDNVLSGINNIRADYHCSVGSGKETQIVRVREMQEFGGERQMKKLGG